MRLEDVFGVVQPEIDVVATLNELVQLLDDLTEAHNKLAAVVVELVKRQRGEP